MAQMDFSGDPVHALGLAVFIALLLAAAIWDLRSYRIPNFIPVGLVATYFLVAASGFGRVDWVDGLFGCLVALAVGIPLLHWRIMGGGDVKLFAAVAAWIGLKSLALLALLVGFTGAWWAVALIVLRMPFSAGGQGFEDGEPENIPRLFRPHAPVPYAVSIGFGAILTALHITTLPTGLLIGWGQ